MLLDLTNVRAKLARAQEHAQTFDNEIKSWVDRKPYSLTEQANADSTRYSLILRENEPAPFQRWTLMLADCLNNLRAALDYLVYTIAVFEYGSSPPPYEGRLMFPITDCRTKFDEAVSQWRLGQISEPVRAIFESLQPYNRPDPTLPPLLRILRELNNVDKHRLLKLAYGAIAQGHLGLKGEHPPDGRQFQPVLNTGELKDGAEVFAMVCDRPTPNMKWDKIEVVITVVIWHGKRDPSGPDFTGHTEVSALVASLGDEVRSVVYTFCKTV